MKFISTSKRKKTVTKVMAVILAVLFVLSTIAAILPTLVDAKIETVNGSTFLRVGLFYGDSAVSSLAMTSDTGFEIGTYDAASGFVPTAVFASYPAVVASVYEGGAGITTPEWNPVCTLADSVPTFIRASGGGNIGVAENLYTGIIEITFVAGALKVVNIADLEDYVKGVVVSEVYTSWPMEALKTQAIVARSFTLHNGTKHGSDGFDICATQHCQAYKGIATAVPATNAAVDETRGLVVAYNGEPALTTYHSSSGQSTESAGGAWGSDPQKYPYLCGVDTGFDDTENYRNGRWSYTVSASALAEYINSKPAYEGILQGGVENIVCEKREGSDYVYKITVSDSKGNEIVVEKSTQVRNLLYQYCKSACFNITTCCPVYASDNEEYILDTANMYVITADGPKTLSAPMGGLEVLTADGFKPVYSAGEKVFTISGVGYGHGVGLSQYGAMTLAEQGHDCNYILSLYYPGTVIADYRTLGAQE
ncbi:MAG: SpoIID/LytB domain-containing protein [Clostridia bacterium]|nr:SpoIID/LytB domain-containing protein [Clostridia bacterium]